MTAEAALRITRETGLDLYRQMLRIRRFEETCAELYSAGSIRGFLHLYIGEEAVAAGAMPALGPDDAIVAVGLAGIAFKNYFAPHWSMAQTRAELEAVRRRLLAVPTLPPARLDRRDYGAAVAIFGLVTLGTFPVALPFLVWEPGPALLVSRVLTLTMLFICGLALGRHAGGGGWKAGLGMTVLGVVLTAAIIALGG